MTLYTIMPLEQVLEGIHQEPPASVEIQHDGMLLQIQPVAPGAGRLIRILDGSLERYLNPAYSPGSMIFYMPAEG